MFGSLQQAFKVGDLRTKLLFTLMMLLVFRVGAHIAVPGINAEAIQQLLSGQLFGFFDIISGGAFKRFSIFAMSITPYINASIIMSLLKVVIPAWMNCPRKAMKDVRLSLSIPAMVRLS